MKKSRIMIVFSVLLCVFLCAGCGATASDVQFSKESGDYLGQQMVELSNNGEGKIAFTLDGSDPTQGGFEYENPIVLNYTTTVKACTVLDGKTGTVSENTYTITPFEEQTLTDDERWFLSNISGTFVNGDSKIVVGFDRVLQWENIDGDSGESDFLISLPDNFDGYQGTLTYIDNTGKAATFNVDSGVMGDNLVDFNGISYTYVLE